MSSSISFNSAVLRSPRWLRFLTFQNSRFFFILTIIFSSLQWPAQGVPVRKFEDHLGSSNWRRNNQPELCERRAKIYLSWPFIPSTHRGVMAAETTVVDTDELACAYWLDDSWSKVIFHRHDILRWMEFDLAPPKGGRAGKLPEPWCNMPVQVLENKPPRHGYSIFR